jgi:hypothetical protein
MPWSQEQQMAAEVEFFGYLEAFNVAYANWVSSVQSGNPGPAAAAVDDVLRRWRASLELLRSQSETLMNNAGVMDMLDRLVVQVTDERETLKRLRGEAVTRSDQADSLNPKVRPSPYTNLLGLQRTFRQSTRTGLMIASIVIGILALLVLGFLIWRIVVTRAVAVESSGLGSMSGGSRLRN